MKTKQMLYYFAFYLTLGFIVNVLQHIVLEGLPINLTSGIWVDWLGGALHMYLYIAIQKRVLLSFSSEFKKQDHSLPLIMRYFIIAQVLGTLLLIVYSMALTALTKRSLDIKFKDIEQLRFIFVYFFLIHTVLYTGGVALRLYYLYNKEKDAKYQAEKSFLSAQLQLLRQQLNPHFLFNNLNIIASTINNNPKLAYEFTKSMASFYRKVLETENSGWILLKDEIKTIRSYLYMLGVRFEDKLLFTIDVPDQVQQNYAIPDFILQPIVENAVKHNVISKEKPLQIEIAMNETGKLLIKNSYNPKQSNVDSVGVGWFNIESRYKYLGAKAPTKYVKDDWFCVEVSLIKSDNH